MNIAICDDSIEMSVQLEEIVDYCFGGNQNNYVCETYLSGEELMEVLESGKVSFQIYLLDIEMREINGLEVAALIREFDEQAVIIFVTSHSELMQEAFDVAAFHYLTKPIDEKKAKQVLIRAIKVLYVNRLIFQFNKRKKTYTLYLSQIEYLESYKRKIKIYADDKVYEYYGNIKEAMEKLDHTLFAQIHVSYAVNMEKVLAVNGDSVILKSGKQIYITKKYLYDFNEAYKSFVLLRTPI